MRLAQIAIAACAMLLGFAAPAMAAPPPASLHASDQPFRRGVNVLGYDPYWTDSSKRRFQWRHFAEIRKAGFDFIRVPLYAFRHMDAQNRLDTVWLAKLDDVVKEAQRAGLGIILDEHDFDTCSGDLTLCRAKLPSFWQQVAPRFANAPRNVAFELLNEPHAKLDAANWNALFGELLGIVRRTNPTRIVVVGPTSWNSFKELPSLKLPDDPNLLVTFHYYDPFHFTHQGAGWAGDVKNLHGITWGTPQDRAAINADFDRSPPGQRRTTAQSCSASSAPTTRAARRSRCGRIGREPSGAKPSGTGSAGPIGSSTATSSSGTCSASSGLSQSAKRWSRSL
jgi:endoglucanase